jgi:MoaA/NifB/PqqE/SkfB family radical SAM enzyme
MFFLDIDVVGTCNLKCPSCPVGNWNEFSEPQQFMTPEMLSKILHKAKNECQVCGVGLFNWTEPLLHPNLAEMVEIVQSNGFPCFLSSNLNILKNIEHILKANPYALRISLSGFTQKHYAKTHRGGDIEKVKKNMQILADLKQELHSSTKIEVLYHRYLHNLGSEEQSMRDFTKELGFDFHPVWAFMMPLEKVLKLISPESSLTKSVHISEEDLELVKSLALPIDELYSQLVNLKQYKSEPCSLQNSHLTINHKGEVQLCCAVYDSSKYSLASYLDTPLLELQKMKQQSSMCHECIDLGLHKYVTYEASGLEELALYNVGRSQLSFPNESNVSAQRTGSIIF